MTDAQENIECPITAMLELIGGKWKPIILYNLTSGTRRFGQIDVRIPGISRKVLTEQLRQLEKDGLIKRKEYNEIPPRVEYSLTELGESLSPVFKEMASWGKEHVLGNG
ncbi:transcriptional regulator, HxlR family [Fodinibius roseus]|uniref:Transcriptional regulator, HxlR family n=1 Tax=Fodinibius roseus TaxID=1194090 RepID=A0A1M4YUN1_9BACT|nr:helix-turn-helix domain-containing protein [Fodinibius roseus]SHF09463.1 transcriptional regulator, HxlR family [Fodinibius roseus]